MEIATRLVSIEVHGDGDLYFRKTLSATGLSAPMVASQLFAGCASKPSEHPPDMGRKCKNVHQVGGNIGCQDKTSSWHLIGFPDGSNVGSMMSGKNPSLYHTPSKHRKVTMSLDTAEFFNIGFLQYTLK